MTIQECYACMGADYAEVMYRLGKEERIEKYLGKLLRGNSFSELCAAVEEQRWADAFASAHSLKNLSLNLALTRLSRTTGLLCDALRHKLTEDDISALMTAVRRDYGETCAMVSALLGGRDEAAL